MTTAHRGRLFLDEARDILAQTDRAAVVARRASIEGVGRLRVGFAYWMDVTPLVAVVKRLYQGHNGTRVDIRTMSVPRLVAALKEDDLDVALLRPPLGEPSLRTADVTSEPFVVALPPDHRLAARTHVSVAALADEPFILFPRAAVPQFHDLAVKLCREAGPGVAFRSLKPSPRILKTVIAWRFDNSSAAVKAFVEMVREAVLPRPEPVRGAKRSVQRR